MTRISRLQQVCIASFSLPLLKPSTVKPLIQDTPKEDKPPKKRQADESTLMYTLYRKSPLKEGNLSTKDKTACPESVFKRFHCIRGRKERRNAKEGHLFFLRTNKSGLHLDNLPGGGGKNSFSKIWGQINAQ